MNELIRFPHAGATWIDTEEGGMYVFAVVPRPVGHKDNCTVENGIVLTPPDDAVSDIRDFWGDPESAAAEKRARDEAARLMDRKGFAAQAATVRGLVSLDSLSVEMLAAVHMGSTGRSLKIPGTGGPYWEASREDLTFAGALLIDHLHLAFGIEPTLLTFLDT